MAYDMTAYQDPNQGWYGGGEFGYDEYYGYDQPYEEETESQKLRKEQEMIEEIESNRLYLKKVRKRCVKEDFADLEKTQMFLFEFLIESLEVNTASELGLVPDSDESPELVARVQFLDTPYLEIREKGEKIEGSDSVLGQTEYFGTVGNAGLYDAYDPGRNVVPKQGSPEGSIKEADTASGEQPEEGEDAEAPTVEYDSKWENSSGKSLLFSKSALEIIQGLDRSPVRLQVSRCIEPTEEEEKGTCEPLGYALVRLPEHFSLSVLQSCKPGVILPVSCVHRDTCEIRNVFGLLKGELKVFVRLSCFGSVITTSFQSVGPDRQYVFKPSPQPDPEGAEESEIKRDLLLKPIVAEEEVAKGFKRVSKEVDDMFLKSVLWKNNPKNCGCIMDDSSDYVPLTESSLRMPRPSGASLCRDANPPHQPGKPFCDWHNMVKKEIQNKPGGNCGCLDDLKVIKSPIASLEGFGPSSPTKTRGPKTTKAVNLDNEPDTKKPSRIEKMHLGTKPESQPEKPVLARKVPEQGTKPITGFGIQTGPSDCNCDCAGIRTSLAKSPMMKYTWQVK